MPTTHTVDCNAGEKIQDKIAIARPGDTRLSGSVAGYADGPLGTLDGVKGAKEIDGSCVDRVTRG